MAKERPGVMIYFDILPALEKMGPADTGKLFIAVLRYAQEGVLPELEGATDLVWSFIKSNIDRDGARYRKKQLQGQWKAYCREEKRHAREYLEFDDWLCEQQNKCYQMITDDNICYPTTSTTPPASPALITPTSTPTNPTSFLNDIRETAAAPQFPPASDHSANESLDFESKRKNAMDMLERYNDV